MLSKLANGFSSNPICNIDIDSYDFLMPYYYKNKRTKVPQMDALNVLKQMH